MYVLSTYFSLTIESLIMLLLYVIFFPLSVKAFEAVCTDGSECGTGVCDKNQCGCLATHYYDSDAGICKLSMSVFVY